MKTDWRINGKQETHVPKWSPENNKLKLASEDSIKMYFGALYLHDLAGYFLFCFFRKPIVIHGSIETDRAKIFITHC